MILRAWVLGALCVFGVHLGSLGHAQTPVLQNYCVALRCSLGFESPKALPLPFSSQPSSGLDAPVEDRPTFKKLRIVTRKEFTPFPMYGVVSLILADSSATAAKMVYEQVYAAIAHQYCRQGAVAYVWELFEQELPDACRLPV